MQFLAIDFDKKTYEKDVTAFWNTCTELNIPVKEILQKKEKQFL